jgi:hypothetical protein
MSANTSTFKTSVRVDLPRHWRVNIAAGERERQQWDREILKLERRVLTRVDGTQFRMDGVDLRVKGVMA